MPNDPLLFKLDKTFSRRASSVAHQVLMSTGMLTRSRGDRGASKDVKCLATFRPVQVRVFETMWPSTEGISGRTASCEFERTLSKHFGCSELSESHGAFCGKSRKIVQAVRS